MPTRLWSLEGCGIGLRFTGYCDLEARRPGAVAHMSLHQKPTMSKSHQTKEADSEGVPRFGNRGTGCPFMLATDAVDGGSRQRRVGGAHLGAV